GLDDFKGAASETTLLYDGKKEKRLLLVGLGKKSECTPEVVRKAYGSASAWIRKLKLKSVNVVLPEGGSVFALAEGFALNNYAFENLKSKKEEVLIQKIVLLDATKAELEDAVRAAKLAEAVCFARDLVNGNADDVTPQYLAKIAQELSKLPKVKTQVLDKKAIEKEKMGLLLAVNRGSKRDPHILIVRYEGAPQNKEHTVVVGKGVTYDTGGLNLKPTGSMEEMKTDMGGSAAALGAIKAAALLGLKVNLTAVVPTTENCIDALSYKPGDVYTSYQGTTVEIFNTDAEGRLILADALAYAVKKLKPTRIVDFATLTGAIVIALGEERSGLFSNNDKLAKALEEAGDRSGEKVWRFPLDTEYKELLKSDIADIKNCAKRQAGSITAAIFLQEFVGNTPWAHVDIA
ncbi:MAG TPA: leucyl aminopeptidase, partial [Chlamydiales bacterium]|nr:leucyl aminopeptidase [Chlamydiales bacterium]